jgi:hypothetical protein
MKIDRSRFLMLTGALSAATALGAAAIGGCSSSSTTVAPDASVPPTDSGVTTDGGGTTDASDAGTDSGACLGDTAPADAGDAGDGGLDCTAAADTACQAGCEAALANLRAGIAFAAADCILKLPSCEGAATDVIGACIEAAAGKACADSTAATYCQDVFAACTDAGAPVDAGDAGGFTQADCEKAAVALNQTGRDTFMSCMVESGGSGCADPQACLDALK